MGLPREITIPEMLQISHNTNLHKSLQNFHFWDGILNTVINIVKFKHDLRF